MRRNILSIIVPILLCLACAGKPAHSLVGAWGTQEDARVGTVLVFAADGNFEMMAVNEFAAGLVKGHYQATADHIQLDMTSGTGLSSVTYTYEWQTPDEMTIKSTLDPNGVYKLKRLPAGSVPSLNSDWGVGPSKQVNTESAMATTCLSNLRQTGTAALLYSQDYDGTLPEAETWTTTLIPYTKVVGIYNCPKVSKDGQRGGYSMNSAISSANTRSPGQNGTPSSSTGTSTSGSSAPRGRPGRRSA